MELALVQVTVEVWLLAAALAVATLLGLKIGQASRPRRLWRRWRTTGRSRKPQGSLRTDHAEAVAGAAFSAKSLLNRPEQRVLRGCEAIVREMGVDWRVYAQASLGEVLRSTNQNAYAAINAKRVDFLVVDADHMPLAAVEYHGEGHHIGSDAFMRDAIKREALRSAGIDYIEVAAGHKPGDLRSAFMRLAERIGPVERHEFKALVSKARLDVAADPRMA